MGRIVPHGLPPTAISIVDDAVAVVDPPRHRFGEVGIEIGEVDIMTLLVPSHVLKGLTKHGQVVVVPGAVASVVN